VYRKYCANISDGKGKHLSMFNVQLCLTFERVSIMFWSLPLCRRV